MAKNSGKAFETAIRKSFDAAGWWCLRITDNVYKTGASVKTPADFIAVSPMKDYTKYGVTFLIECKSTEQTSLPLSNITEYQRWSLQEFDEFGVGTLIVLFRKTKKCYAIISQDAFHRCESLGRKSLTEDICAETGVRLPKDGSTYDITKLSELW